RAAVAHIDVVFGRLLQRLAHRRRQTRAYRDRVALAVTQPFDAELLFFRGDRRLVVAFERDERREIRALAGQVLGELETGAWASRIRIDGVIQNAESVLVAQL